MAAGDIYRLSMVGDWSAVESAVITSHVRFKSPGATPDGAAELFKANLLALLGPKQSNTWAWRYVNWLSENLLPVRSGVYTTGFPVLGTLVSESLPYTVAAVVSLRTQYAGRSYRGRMYLPAVTEADSVAGRLSIAWVNAVQTYFEDLLANCGGSGSNADYEWGVYSRKLAVFTPYLAAIVREVPGTVRRRRPGVGT